MGEDDWLEMAYEDRWTCEDDGEWIEPLRDLEAEADEAYDYSH